MKEQKTVLFLADAHLRGPADPNQELVQVVLRRYLARGAGLVVIGDLFDFLAGDNRTATEVYRPVLDLMAQFHPFYYFEGNHDFDLSPRTKGLTQAIIHPGPATVKLNGFRIRLMHGDRTCPNDVGTRWLRKVLQSGLMRLVRDRLLSDRFVFQFALRFATASRNLTWPGRGQEPDSARNEALQQGKIHDTDAAIFAHTHRCLLEEHPHLALLNPGPANLGGSFATLKGDALCLHRFPDGKDLPPGPVRLRSQDTESPPRSQPKPLD